MSQSTSTRRKRPTTAHIPKKILPKSKETSKSLPKSAIEKTRKNENIEYISTEKPAETEHQSTIEPIGIPKQAFDIRQVSTWKSKNYAIQLSEQELVLFNACKLNDIDMIYKSAFSNVDLSCKIPFYGTCPLAVTYKNGYISASNVLLAFGSKHLSDSYGAWPIHWACNFGQDSLIQDQLQRGYITKSDLQKKDFFGSTPLHYASVNNLGSTVKLLVENGASCLALNNDSRCPDELTSDISIRDFLLSEKLKEYMAPVPIKSQVVSKSKKKSVKSRSSANSAQEKSQKPKSVKLNQSLPENAMQSMKKIMSSKMLEAGIKTDQVFARRSKFSKGSYQKSGLAISSNNDKIGRFASTVNVG